MKSTSRGFLTTLKLATLGLGTLCLSSLHLAGAESELAPGMMAALAGSWSGDVTVSGNTVRGVSPPQKGPEWRDVIPATGVNIRVENNKFKVAIGKTVINCQVDQFFHVLGSQPPFTYVGEFSSDGHVLHLHANLPIPKTDGLSLESDLRLLKDLKKD